MLWGGYKEQNTQRGRGYDPCKVPLVTPDLQNFIISASVFLIIRKLPSHLSLESAYVGVCTFVCDGVMRPSDTLLLIISKHSLQTFIDQPQLHQSFALPSYSSGWPMSQFATSGLTLSKAASVLVCTILKGGKKHNKVISFFEIWGFKIYIFIMFWGQEYIQVDFSILLCFFFLSTSSQYSCWGEVLGTRSWWEN